MLHLFFVPCLLACGAVHAASGLDSVAIPILEQDIRSDFSSWAQHRQQPTTRIGVRSGHRYRSLAWLDLSTIPAGAVVDDVRLVYWTTSGNPQGVGRNGDVGNIGSLVDVELRKILKPWNYDEPRTHPSDLADNDTPAGPGETSWNHALYPQTWEVPGASGPTDSVMVAMVGTVASTFDTRFELAAPALVSLVQSWIDTPASNHGYMLKVSDVNEAQTGAGNRKILCGKGFPLETSTGLETGVAETHRPQARITYHLP